MLRPRSPLWRLISTQKRSKTGGFLVHRVSIPSSQKFWLVFGKTILRVTRLGTRAALRDIASSIILLMFFFTESPTDADRNGEFPHTALSPYVAEMLHFYVGQGIPTLDGSSLGGVNSGH
jgi:hypothetical protein